MHQSMPSLSSVCKSYEDSKFLGGQDVQNHHKNHAMSCSGDDAISCSIPIIFSASVSPGFMRLNLLVREI